MRNISDPLDDCGNARFADAAEVFSSSAQGPVVTCISIPKSSKINAQIRFKTRLTDQGRPHYLYHNIYQPIEVKTINSGDRERHLMTQSGTIKMRRSKRQPHLVDGSTVAISLKRTPQTPRFLSALRTSAGLFVPCIATPEQFVWRTRKPLEHNPALCLTFEFGDNPRGYRDFTEDDRGSHTVEFPTSDSKRLNLVQSRSPPQSGPPTRAMTLDDMEVLVDIAKFNTDVRDGLDDDYDILQKTGREIDTQSKEQQKDMKATNAGRSE
ncbi:hypothetical protein LX36DRAFT_716610 [Colletotrichum falcatum]|nr:hypothetical protein LX36DRAFT_716610 [Colletotrichum falcatum]